MTFQKCLQAQEGLGVSVYKREGSSLFETCFTLALRAPKRSQPASTRNNAGAAEKRGSARKAGGMDTLKHNTDLLNRFAGRYRLSAEGAGSRLEAALVNGELELGIAKDYIKKTNYEKAAEKWIASRSPHIVVLLSKLQLVKLGDSDQHMVLVDGELDNGESVKKVRCVLTEGGGDDTYIAYVDTAFFDGGENF